MGEMAGATVARTKAKPAGRNDVAVKLDRAVVGKARLIATHKDVSVAELLTELVRGPVDKAYAVMLRELEGKG
jgi:hypothetical protein